jgi:hypothetical protein
MSCTFWIQRKKRAAEKARQAEIAQPVAEKKPVKKAGAKNERRTSLKS